MWMGVRGQELLDIFIFVWTSMSKIKDKKVRILYKKDKNVQTITVKK